MSGGTNSSSCPPFDRKEYANVAIASAVSAVISLVAGCFVISVMVLLQKWKFFSQRLILYLAIATIFTSIATILHRVDFENQTSDFYTRFCILGGFLEQVTSWIFLNANSAITIYLFMNVVVKIKTDCSMFSSSSYFLSFSTGFPSLTLPMADPAPGAG